MTNDPANPSPHSPRHGFDINLMLVMPPILTVRRVPFSLLVMDTPAWAVFLYDWHIREASEASDAGFPDIHHWFNQVATSINRWFASGQSIVTQHPFLAQRQLLRPWVIGKCDLPQYCLSVLENSQVPVRPGVDVLLMIDDGEAAMFTTIPAIAAHGGDYVQTTQVTEEEIQMLVQQFTAMLEKPI